ncbi:MAG: photosynthetic reaction center subunit H [Alphaproteobacteria bacterium]|nr:photosynthetic reaction center subunit H [Alphaproteobacteria bacterium]
MPTEVFNGRVDVTEWVLYAFFLFFVLLVLYLRREDRREGYPLEDDQTGRLEPGEGLLFFATPKTFSLGDGGSLSKPDGMRDERTLNARRTAPWPGAPIEPVDNPLTAGVGPGAYAERAKAPDTMHDGRPTLAPLRAAAGFSFEEKAIDLRGWPVVGADNGDAGVVKDVWVDQAEVLIRYLEVDLAGGGGSVLVPMPLADLQRGRKRVKVDAVLAAQFAGAPRTQRPDVVTLDEEERIAAYFGAGLLYATPARSEPWL